MFFGVFSLCEPPLFTRLRDARRILIDRLKIDAIIVVDGGTDILMRGDETGLGMPEKDMTSLAALEREGAYPGAFSIPAQSAEAADDMAQVSLLIEEHRDHVDPRRWRAIPH